MMRSTLRGWGFRHRPLDAVGVDTGDREAHSAAIRSTALIAHDIQVTSSNLDDKHFNSPCDEGVMDKVIPHLGLAC